MPSPAPSWGTVRVRAVWVNQDGSRKTGTWRLTIPVRVTNATDDLIIPKGTVTGNLSTSAGQPSLDIQVPSGNDPDNFPSGFQPILVVTFSDGSPEETYVLDVPASLVGDPNGVNLRAFVLPETIPTAQNVLVRGVPGGLAGLNSAGQVVDATNTPVVGGGGSTTNAAALTTGILPPARIGDASITDAKLVSGTALTPAERTKLAGAAPLDSPTFTGTPTAPAPTVAGGIANKGYVDAAVSIVAPTGVLPGRDHTALRGLNVAGPEFSVGQGANWPTATDIANLAGRGQRLIRMPFRWDDMQPVLDGPLSTTEAAAFQVVLDAAKANGVAVIADLHSYGGYGAKTSPKIGAVGGPTITQFANFWLTFATRFGPHPALFGYDLMNEPESMPLNGFVDARSAWYAAAQAAVNSIRTVDAYNFVIMESYSSASMGSWQNGKGGGFATGTLGVANKNVITDPSGQDKILWSPHHYFDGSGVYTSSYAAVMATKTYPNPNDGTNPPFRDILEKAVILELRGYLTWLVEQQANGFIGEWGVPRSDTGTAQQQADAPLWAAIADRWFDEIDTWQRANPNLKLWVTQWAGGEAWSATYLLRMYSGTTPYLPGQVSERHRTPAASPTVTPGTGTTTTTTGVVLTGGSAVGVDPDGVPYFASSAVDIGHDVILLAGQSNMVGYGQTLDTDFDIQHPRIWQFPGSGANLGNVIIANDPLIHEVGQIPNAIGHAMTFARWYADSIPSNRRVLLVPTAHGSTTFGDPNSANGCWDPTPPAGSTAKNLAAFAVAQTNAAIAAHPGNRFIGTLWHQGEGDASLGTTAAAYIAFLDELITYFRTNITGAANSPFVLGQMMPEGIAASAGKQRINPTHIATPGRTTRTGFWFGPSGYPVTGSLDHYNAFGNRIAGGRAFSAFLRARLNVTGTAAQAPTTMVLTQASTTSVAATWDQPMGRVTSFEVQYQVNGGAFTAHPHTTLDITTTKTALVAGNAVIMRVRSINEQATPSAWRTSNTIVLAAGPGQVTGLTAGATTSATQVLNWTAVANVTSYLVEYKRAVDTVWTTFGNPTTTTVTVTGLSAGTSYNYRVSGVSGAGAGTPSTTLTVSTTGSTFLATDVGVAFFRAVGLRKLTSTATQCIRVRNGTTNVETDIGFAANGDIDEAAMTTAAGTADLFVVTWYDQSGNARNLTQATAANQAQIATAGTLNRVGTRLFATFDGVNDNYSGTAVGLYAAGVATGAAVMRAGAGAVQSIIVGEGGATAVMAYGLINNSGSNRLLGFVRNDANVSLINSGATGGLLSGTAHTAVAVDDGTSYTPIVDGVAGTATAYTRSGVLTLTKAVMGAFGTNMFTGDLAEAVSFTVALNPTQRAAMQTNQKTYYGTP